MESNYFNQYYYLERNNWWFQARLKILELIIKKYNENYKCPLRILNVGVATGATSEMLQNYGEVTSIEFDKDCCAFLKAFTNVSVVHGSVLDLPFEENSFDLVCCFDVIEHVANDKKAIQELNRVCAADGHIFITVPAFQLLWSNHDVINHHFRRYVSDEVKKMFCTLPLTLVYATYFNFFLFVPIAIFRISTKLLNILLKENNKGSDFDYKFGFLQTIFYKILYSESYFMLRGISFPFGISFMCLYKKESTFIN